ncbi:MAG: NAD-binding protein [Methanoregulaceae archaeon]
MSHKRGAIWRLLRNSPGMQIALYFFAFAMLIGLYTYIFHDFYPLLENKPISWSAALFFVVSSMTTVGYSDLPAFTNDLTIFLTIQIMISGVIMIFIVVPLLLAPFLTTLLAPTPPRRTPHPLRGHIVIFGYDELSRSLIETLMISDVDIVIVEKDKATALDLAARLRKRAYVIWGEYTDPDTFLQAHIKSATFIVIDQNEHITANIILGIRELTKGRILAVVDKLSFDRYLRYAGAEYVLSPKYTTGRILARHTLLTPNGDAPVDIPGLDRLTINLGEHYKHELRLINIPIVSGCRATGKTLKDLNLFERYGIFVPFLWKSGTFNPEPKEFDLVDNTTSLYLFGRSDAISATIRNEFETDRTKEDFAIIVGFGDVGMAAYQELQSAGISCTVVDAKQHGINEVVGNAEDEDVLKKAKISDAQLCIVALNNDDVNIFTTLMARNLNPNIRIMARANEPSSVDKLYRAGADYVALLPTIGGQIIGRILLSDNVSILLDLPNDEKVVMKHVISQSKFTVGLLRRKSGARIIGVESGGQSIVLPNNNYILKEGDAVIAYGETDQLKRLIHRL